MKIAAAAIIAVLLASPVAAKDALIKLSAEDAARLNGKSLALTTHQRPSFVAMTAGKASFALLGAGAMIAAGNKMVDENGIADPAILLREHLASGLRDAFGVVPSAPDATATASAKPNELAALHLESDYVLDVRSAGWNYAYYPTQWSTYWVGYSVQVQLIETASKRAVSNAACNANTNKHPHSPSREALLADGAKLLKDVTAALGWTCVQLLAKEQFQLPEGSVPAIPAEFTDPLAAYAGKSAIPASPAAEAPAAVQAPAADPSATP